jgi:hypothetical protein
MSKVNANYPVFGNPTTQSVRDNFSYTASESDANAATAANALTIAQAAAPLAGATFTGTVNAKAGFTATSTLANSFTFSGAPIDVASPSNWWSGQTFDINNTTYGAYLRSNRNDNGQRAARWVLELGNDAPERGGNSGCDFALERCDDSGNALDYPLTIARQTGLVSVGSGGLTIVGNLTVQGSANLPSEIIDGGNF